MIRAANHSSYPKIGEHTFDQQLRVTLLAHERGEVTAADVAAIEDEVATIVVAEQSRAFIHIVTDGMLRWEGPLSHVARHLDGLEHGRRARWFETQFHDRQPVVVGPIARQQPFLVHDYEVAADTAQTPVKIVLPGAVTFARLAEDRHYGSVERLAEALAEVLAAEVACLAAVGATCFQIDEPLLCRRPDDLDLVARTAERVFGAAGDGATTVLSTYFGDLSAVAGQLDRLPGTHLGLDMVHGAGNLDVLERLPDGKGVALGLWDARTTRTEDAADAAALLEPYRERLTTRDVMVGPQAGLELLPRDQAFDKLQQARYLAEQLEREWAWA